MNQRQSRRHRRRMKKKSLGGGPDPKRQFLDTMKQHLDTTMDEARSRYMKVRDQGRFFFLKGGEAWPPSQAESPMATQIASKGPALDHLKPGSPKPLRRHR